MLSNALVLLPQSLFQYLPHCLALFIRADSISMLNLRVSAMRLLQVRCPVAYVLLRLKMSGDEFAMNGGPFADQDPRHRYILKLWPIISLQYLYGRIISMQTSLGSTLSYERFSQVLDANQGFTVPKNVLSSRFIESLPCFTGYFVTFGGSVRRSLDILMILR